MNIAHLYYFSSRWVFTDFTFLFDLQQNVPCIFCTFCYIVVVFVCVENLFTFYFHPVVCDVLLSALNSLAILCLVFPVLLFYILINLIVLALSKFPICFV